MVDLTSLLERVRAASGPDRELDELLWKYFEPLLPKRKRRIQTAFQITPLLTISIDAAVALAEHMGSPIHTAHRNKVGIWAVTLFPDGEAEHALFPLAILAALLTAMQKD